VLLVFWKLKSWHGSRVAYCIAVIVKLAALERRHSVKTATAGVRDERKNKSRRAGTQGGSQQNMRHHSTLFRYHGNVHQLRHGLSP
jgi:hypothetical protein